MPAIYQSKTKSIQSLVYLHRGNDQFANMAPNLEDTLSLTTSPDPVLYLSPLIPYNNNTSSPSSSDDEFIEDALISNAARIVVPLEQNLHALLVKVTGTEDLERVTQLKLRVIARDVPLQHLHVHIPALRELILDGSVVSTLRDLGCGLRNLKILRVNRCALAFLDGMFAFEGLEELYAADNAIENPMPCVFLPNVRIIDLRRNRLQDILHSLSFLSLCEKLEHIYLEGNDEISQFPKYRQTVKTLLPALRSLDGISYSNDEFQTGNPSEEFQHCSTAEKSEIDVTETPRNRPQGITEQAITGFTVRFPPKVCLDRPTTMK